jgi:CHAT domain-containing protein/Flp pilus assembly protein TadD
MSEEDKEARADSLFDKGVEAYKCRDFRAAGEAFAAALNKYKALIAEGRTEFRPDCAITRMNLGNCLSDLGDIKAASSAYEETLKDYDILIDKEKRTDLRPSRAKTRMDLGFCLYSLGDIEAARSAYEETLKDYEALIDKEKRTDLRPSRARTRMNLGNCLSDLGDLEAARGAYEETLKDYEVLIDKEKHTELRPERARTRMNLGNCLSNLGELYAARSTYEETLKDYDALKKRTELRPDCARTRMNLGICLKNLGDLSAARSAYEETLKDYDALIDKEKRTDLRSDRARTRMNLGICLKNLGELSAARGTYEEALKDYDVLIDKEKHFNLRPSRAITRMNLGNCLSDIGDLEAARCAYEETLKDYEALIDKEKRTDLRPERARTRMNLGICLKNLGDLEAARSAYEETLKDYEALIDKEKRFDLWPERAITRMNLGICLSELGDIEAARSVYEETLKDYDALIDKEKRTDLRPERTVTCMNLGNCLSELGDLKAARSVYEETLKDYDALIDKEKHTNLRPERAITRMNLGNCLSDLGDFKAARSAYEETLKDYDALIDKESDWRPERAITRMNLGNCLKKLGDLPGAETNYQATLSLLQELQAAGQLFPDAIKMMRIIVDWQRNPQRPASPDKPRAFELAKLGLDWLETFLNRNAAKLLEQNMPLFHLAADLALELDDFDQAYIILERSKSCVLVEQMLREHAEPSVDEHLRTQYRKLNTRLRELVNQLAIPMGGDTAPITRTNECCPQLWQEQQAVEQELDKVRCAIAEQDPAFGEAISPRPLEPEQIARLLPANTLAIAFDQRPDYLHLYAITAQGVHAPQRVDLNMQQVTERVKSFRDNIGVAETNQISDWLTSTLALAVTQLLNIPQPKNKQSNRRSLFNKLKHQNFFSRKALAGWQEILLIPHQAWHLLPLHLLKIDGKLLVQHYPVRYISALQVLRLIQKRKQAKLGNGCIISNPDGSLPAAQREALTVKNLLPDDALLEGKQASLKTVLQYLETAHHGHFACHGYFKPELNAALKLADGSLQAKELFASLRLPNSRLVVLSACETAHQIKLTLADEYMGLVSGFLFAGAHNVLAALWRVDEDSTRLLMEDFYQGLADGLSPTLALQQAQRQLKDMPRETVQARLHSQKAMSKTPYREPYYWSGFVLVGDGV